METPCCHDSIYFIALLYLDIIERKEPLPLKILLVGNYYYPEHLGGVEIVSFNLVKHYREFSHEVRWAAADVLPNLRVAGRDDVPISSWNIAEEKLGFPHPLPHPNVLKKLFDNIHWCDVVHLQDSLYLINILAFFIAKLLGKPVLLTQYAKFIPYKQYYKRFLQTAAYRTVGWLMFNFTDRLAFITENVRAGMAYLTPKTRQEVVPLGVDTDLFTPLAKDERARLREQLSGSVERPIILFVGRLVERKGVHLIRPLIEKYQDWFWVLVGRPDDFNPSAWKFPNLRHLQDLSEDELSRLFSAADILVHPSVGEGITLTVSNSLACGTPVLISEESLYELDVEARKLFYAVSPEINDIEEKLNLALSDRVHLQNLGAVCRDFAVSRLSWKKMCERYSEILSTMPTRNNKRVK